MKILYIANARIPSEKAHPYQILKMCEAFAKNGADINLILPFRVQTTKKLKPIADIWKYYGIDKEFKITKLPSFDLVWTDKYYPFLPWIGIIIFKLQNMSFGILAVIYVLFKKTDICYTRDSFFASTFGFLQFWNKRKIYYEAHKFEHPISKLLKKGRVDRIIVITKRIKEIFLKEGIPEGKILVAPDGADLGMFNNPYSIEDVRKELGIPLEKKIICYTGHLYDWKGVHVLANGMKYLSDGYACYFIGGTEKDILKFKRFIQKNKISNAIVVGYVPPTEIPKYLAASDVVVLPNIRKGNSEFTSPLKLFEYMASKRPIVASNLPSIREILNEKNSILVNPNNPEILADGIKKVINDDKFAKKIVEKAYEDVQEYSWNKRAENILKFCGYG